MVEVFVASTAIALVDTLVTWTTAPRSLDHSSLNLPRVS
jgi:hypothetical protein